jgi:GNAT superfamily N-acetyltransferase
VHHRASPSTARPLRGPSEPATTAVPDPSTEPCVVREARRRERDAVRALTLAAYAEYATVMAPASWAALDGAVRAALDVGFDAAACLVAVPRGAPGAPGAPDAAPLGSVFLFPPAADAYAGLAGAPRWPELRLLAVAPAARGLGVGAALVTACAERARAMGAGTLGLHTSASMRAAQRLYAALGFVRDPERDFRPAGAELVEGYRLPLDGPTAR